MKQQLGTQWWHVVVDRQDKTPPYLQIAATIRHKISTGELPPGTPLPSVRQLMKISGVTSTTVTRSYHLLQGEGLISIQPGVGATVEGAYKLPAKRKDKVSEDIVTQIDEFIHQMLRQGVTKDKLETVILRQIQKATSARYVVYTTAEAVVSKHYASAINSELSDLGVPYASLGRL